MEKTPNWKTEELFQKNNWFVLLKKKVYRRQRFTPLAACAVFVVVGVLIKYAWISPKPELNDETTFKKVTQLEEILNNVTTHISELVDRDVQLTARVSQLEDSNMEQKDKISKLEEANRQQKERITQLEASNKQYQETVSELQVQLVQLEREGSEHIKHVNTTLAESEFNSLRERLTSHITSSQNEHNQLRSSIRGNDRDIKNLQNRIGTVESDIKNLQKCMKWFFWC